MVEEPIQLRASYVLVKYKGVGYELAVRLRANYDQLGADLAKGHYNQPMTNM